MSTFVVDECTGVMEQIFYLKKRIHLASFKAQLYVHNMPAGNFTLELYKGNDLLCSEIINCTDLQGAFDGTKSYFRVFYPFFINRNIAIDAGDYKVRLVPTGYTYNASSWIGWCKDFGGYFGEITDPNAEWTQWPYSFRIIERKRREH